MKKKKKKTIDVIDMKEVVIKSAPFAPPAFRSGRI